MHFRFLVSWYDRILIWSKLPEAPRYLGLVSFIDASLFPISPLFMLLPMSFAAPHRAFYFAFITIVTSLIGGMVGYGLGLFAFDFLVDPLIHWMGYTHAYEKAMQWFEVWGFWAIIIGCISPFIPYKIFTIGAGVLQLHFGWFVVASLIGRTVRFVLIAALIRWGGARFEPIFRRTLIKITNYQEN